MGKRSRTKGKEWERSVARMLRPIFGKQVYRGHQDARAKEAHCEGCDVDGTPFWIETKHKHTVNILEALRQCSEAQTGCGDRRPAVVISKNDKKPPGWAPGKPLSPPLATMELGVFLGLVDDWIRMKVELDEEWGFIPMEVQR